jgi:caffeoyl-CoA O-methyltransferase
MEFISKELSAYCEAHSTEESNALKALNRETHAKILMPRMLSGHLQGRFLSMISHMLQPKRILEIGTFTGYSAICLAEGLAKGGELITIDNNEELRKIAQDHVSKAGFEHQIKLITGQASEEIEKLNGEFDLVFIDADKSNYAHYFEQVIDKVRQGGIIIADNVLWSGKVLEDQTEKTDKDTAALMAFNKQVMLDKRVENVLLPIRDGLMMIRKR